MNTEKETPQHNSNQPENVIFVSFKTNVLKAVERAVEALKTHENVVLSGLNTGITKLIIIAEIIKLKVDSKQLF